jgi:hypothetical protein
MDFTTDIGFLDDLDRVICILPQRFGRVISRRIRWSRYFNLHLSQAQLYPDNTGARWPSAEITLKTLPSRLLRRGFAPPRRCKRTPPTSLFAAWYPSSPTL